MNRVVRSVVVPVHVAEHRRGYHRMVKGRVENPPGGLVRRRDLHLRKFGVPFGIGCLHRRLEIPTGKLGREVRLGTLHAHGPKGHFHEHLFAVVRRERRPGISLPDGLELRKGFRKLRDEIHALILGPARRVAPTRNAGIALLFEVGFGRLVPAAAVFEVEDHGGILSRGERIAVQSHALGGGHLGRDVVAHERHRVITRPHRLFRAVGIRPQARLRVFLLAAGIGHLAHHGHHRHVEQIADARAAQMRMRESDDRGIRVVVARHPIPRLGNARRTHLHHAERHVRAHEDVPVAARTDLRVYEARVIPLGGRLRAGCQQQPRCGQ